MRRRIEKEVRGNEASVRVRPIPGRHSSPSEVDLAVLTLQVDLQLFEPPFTDVTKDKMAIITTASETVVSYSVGSSQPPDEYRIIAAGLPLEPRR